MKKVMILGAGTYQVPLIKKAKEMGLYTIVVSIKGDYPGFAFADKVYYIDTTDKEKILEIAQLEVIDGICTTGTDVAVPAIGHVCDQMNLPGVSYKSAVRASDKNIMKELFRKNGVNTAKYKVVYSKDDVDNALETLSFPLIFKAVDSSGSRGIVKVKSKNIHEISKAIELVKETTKKDYYIIEEFIEGEEFGAQALVCNGELKFVMPHGDYVFTGDTGVPIGHYVPYDIDKNLLSKTYIQVELSIKALELDNCAINVDFIMRDDEIYVLEIGARAGATCLPEMISVYYNIDYYKMLLNTALGERVETIDIEGKGMPNACKLLVANKTGIIKSIWMPEEKNSKIIDMSLDYKIGDNVRKFNTGPDRIGQIITCGNTLEEAVDILDNIYNKVKVEVV